MLFLIGGDGTHRGVRVLQEALRAKNIRVSLCTIPVTIDNDLPLVDRSFGFATAVEESMKFVDSAVVESGAAENGVGIIRLQGRHCGFFAVQATLASRDVNICLIPEVHFQLTGAHGAYERIIERATKSGHCVVVVAEGAEQGMVDEERAEMRRVLGVEGDERDASGNIKSVDLADYMVKDLGRYAKEKKGTALTIKYLNPTCALRTTPANGADNDLCHKLSHAAVHCVMAGYTDFCIGLVRDTPVMMPLSLLCAQEPRRFKRSDPEWQRLIASTGQPNFLDQANTQEYIYKREKELDL